MARPNPHRRFNRGSTWKLFVREGLKQSGILVMHSWRLAHIMLIQLAQNAVRLISGVRSNYHIDITRGKWYFGIMNRIHTVKFRMTDQRNDDFVPGTPEERILLVWPLTQEIASLSVKHDVKRRLQRHVTRLNRREG